MRYYAVSNIITLPSSGGGGGGGGGGAGTNVNYFYLLPSFAPGAGTLPAGFLLGWSFTAGTQNGAGAGGMGVAIGSSQVASAQGNATTSSPAGVMQFISYPLKAQTISGLIDIGVAMNTNTIANALVGVGLLTNAGALRSTLLAVSAGNSIYGGAVSGSEYTYWQIGLSLTSQAVTAGDRLVVELGAAVTGSNLFHSYAGGGVPITSTGTLIANAASFVNFQTAIQMQ
jgi:hypothetical protein